MKAVSPSVQMHSWSSTAPRAESDRLEDPVARRASAHRALTQSRGELQFAIDRAAAGGADLRELLATPEIRQGFGATLTASRELRVASALLML